MAEEQKTNTKRKKPLFLRRDWYKKIKFGKGSKKNQKWRGAKGRQNKTRLGRKGYGKRPKIGYGEEKAQKNLINGHNPIHVANMKDLTDIKSGSAIMIASVGTKKRKEIIAKANEMKLIILNTYKDKENKK